PNSIRVRERSAHAVAAPVCETAAAEAMLRCICPLLAKRTVPRYPVCLSALRAKRTWVRDRTWSPQPLMTRSRYQTMFAPHAAFADCIMTQREARSNPAEFQIGGQAMESVIAKLLQDFEQGKMNRRQLIQSLSLAAAAAAAIAPAARAAGNPLEALYVNHVSYEVNDYKKVRDLSVDLLGMKDTEADGKQCRLVFGNNMLIPRNRAGGGPAKVDHIAYTVTNWD